MNRHLVLFPLLAVIAFGGMSPASAQVGGRRLPGDDYFAAHQLFADGDFVTALKGYASASRLKSGGGVWVDSIAHHTMVGECKYHMGNLAGALEQYNTALQIYLNYANWLSSIELPGAVMPSQRTIRKPPTWGTPTRTIRVARIPDAMPSLQGNSDADNARAIQQGGVVSTAHYRLVAVPEIERCIALSLRRRAQLMGPAAQHDRLTSSLVSALSRRPAPAGHWTQAWISCQLGIAYAASGKTAEAVVELKKSLVIGGMDHILTSTSLLELGKLAFKAKDFQSAETFFLESTFSAAILSQEDFTQFNVLGEAFQWGMATQLAAGKKGEYPPLRPAATWANRQSRFLQSSILISAASNAAALYNAKQSRLFLDQAMRSMRRREFRNGTLGARSKYILAQISFQTGDISRGFVALTDAMSFASVGSEWLFQISLADRMYTSGAITPRQAGMLYAEVLRDPLAEDWARDQWESLAVLTVPHVSPYEHWMVLALDRKEHDNAIQISDSLKRHRFYSSLPLGGRVLNLRWMFEAPPEMLSQPVLLRRQALLNRYPNFRDMSANAKQLRAELTKLPPVPEDSEQQQKQNDLLKDLGNISASQEAILSAMALGPDASEPVFPPKIDVTTVQQQLKKGQRVLAFAATENQLFAFLLSEEKYSSWVVKAPLKIRSNTVKMLRAMGHHDKNQPVSFDDLTSIAWKEPAAEILSQLTGNAPADTWNQFDELIIVPDGPIWHVPFEALQIQDGEQQTSLIDKVRIRYVPTVSLAVPDQRAGKRISRTAVVAGRLFPKDDETAAQEALAAMRAEDPNVFEVPTKPLPPSALFSSTIDRLVVFSDLDNDAGGPYDWAPMDLDRGKPGSSLAAWMALPWGAPDQVVLPGFHTPAENALRRQASGDGIFLSVCGLMATGTRTILLSRWRDGGPTSYGLVREFVRELPHRSASAAWQRSVRLAIDTEIDILDEPRIKPPSTETQLKASHPFFWSGYILVDTGVQRESEEVNQVVP